MLTFPQIDPIALQLGPLKIHWYGLMYLVGFACFWALGRLRARRSDFVIKPDEVSDLLFYGAMGVVIGGRLGYVFFYAFDDLLRDPLYLFRIWEGGMSFHGGLLGVAVAVFLYARKLNTSFLEMADFVAPMAPLGLLAGRIGNFINGELWGRPTDVPWAMVFPHVDQLARHPSQLYQAALEGLLLFVILWVFALKPRPRGSVSGLFLVGYGVFRFLAEFFRQPDQQLGFVAFGWMTQGQLLSLPMIVVGLGLMLWAARRRVPV